jgi:hypothetical protein
MRAWRHGGGIGVTAPGLPPAPEVGITCDGGDVLLEWSLSLPNPSSWKIERSDNGADFVFQAAIDGTFDLWVDPQVQCPGLQNSCYRIRGTYSGQNGPYSDPVCIDLHIL